MKSMKSAIATFIVACMLLTLILPVATPSFAAEGQWVLVEVQDNPNDAYWANSNKSPVYEHTYSYGRGVYSAKFTYEGETDTYYNPPYVKGEGLAIQAKWTLPPTTIKKDQKVSLTGSISVTENTQSAFKDSGSTGAWLGNTRLKTADGKTSFETTYNNKYATQTGTVTAILGQGSPGQKKVIELNFFFTNTMWTKFVYEWSETKKPISINQGAPKTNVPVTPSVPVQQNNGDGKLVKTDVKISDLYGEVLIRRGGDEDSWELAEIGTIIYEGDHIKTEAESGIILAMGDMTTFEMKSESELIITSRNASDSKLKLVAGTVYANFKKMMSTGIMEIEMSQAVAGIKGTTFIIEEKDGESILKVLEGTVSFRALKTGASQTVKAGNQAAAIKSGLIFVTPLNISKEASAWKKTIVEMTVGNKTMLVNGIKKEVDPGKTTTPQLVKSKIFAPVKGYAVAFSITQQYDAKSGKLTLKKDKSILVLQVGKTTATLNGKSKSLASAPTMVKGVLMIPLEEVSKLFGYETQWKPSEKKLIIQ